MWDKLCKQIDVERQQLDRLLAAQPNGNKGAWR